MDALRVRALLVRALRVRLRALLVALGRVNQTAEVTRVQGPCAILQILQLSALVRREEARQARVGEERRQARVGEEKV